MFVLSVTVKPLSDYHVQASGIPSRKLYHAFTNVSGSFHLILFGLLYAAEHMIIDRLSGL